MSTEFTINVTQTGHIATLAWNDATTPELIREAVSLAADDAILGRAIHRVEVSLPAEDEMARSALHRAGFRLEGVRRAAILGPNGQYGDVVLYARLASDVVYGPVGRSAVWDSTRAKKRVLAHVLFTNPAGEFLVCETDDALGWLLPGGCVEAGESPRAAAARECFEELRFPVDLGPLLVVDWLSPHLGWSDAVELVFFGGRLDAEAVARLRPDGQEVTGYRWVSPTGPDLARLYPGSLARILAALAAIDGGQVRYLEGGLDLSGSAEEPA